MPKRRGSDPSASRPVKRQRPAKPDHLSSLSDEVLLEILSFLPISALVSCQRLSKRFHDLAGDSELWKQKYYTRWVLPRSRQALRFKHSPLGNSSSSHSLLSPLGLGTSYSPRVSKWPGHGHLVTDGKRLNWKTQFRLRHNWSKGTCRFGALEVSRPPLPQILMKLYSGIVVTADEEHGLRAWSTKASRKQLTALSFPNDGDKPTALFMTRGFVASNIEVTVGFGDGHFEIYDLDVALAKFVLRFSQPSPSSSTDDDASITAIASSPPFLLTISQHKVFSLYRLPHSSADAPTLLASLESSNTFAPVSLSLRCSASEVIASIAYSFFHISGGWTVGIQELRFDQDGERIGSRLASTAACQEVSSSRSRSIRHMETPTSISYSHPYLLTSHNDNTLTMYLVASSSDKLSIRTGRRLWGHTSSVTSVQVGDRGKAVSISPRGNEIRIWELESAVSARSTAKNSREKLRPTSMREESSVQIAADEHAATSSATAAISVETTSGAMSWGREIVQAEYEAVMPAKIGGCVMFDDEQVVVLRERDCRAQLLECYDFT